MTDAGGGGNDAQRDLELIARWKGGDERAATELVERHAAALARFAVSSGERNDVDELVQYTFVRAFNSLDGFRGESSFRTWLFTIERRLLRNPLWPGFAAAEKRATRVPPPPLGFDPKANESPPL